VTDLETRLEAARQRKAAAEARTAAAEAAAAELAVVEAAEREAEDADALAAAVEKHGAVGTHLAIVQTSLGAVIVKRPNGAAYRKWQDAAKYDCVSLEKLVRPCIVSPDATKVDRIFDVLPATLTLVANAVVELAGARNAELSAK
jgi:hypothetical protein